MEITNELKQDLSTLESACGNFLEKYESVLTSALNKQPDASAIHSSSHSEAHEF